MVRFTALADSDSWQLKIRLRPELLLWLALLSVPVMLGLVWGMYFDDSAYLPFSYASSLATGRGLDWDSAMGGNVRFVVPLYTLVLWLAARLGLSLPHVGLVLSVLGWGVTAVAIYSVGRAMHRVVAAVVSSILIAFSPLYVAALGTEIPWLVALACIAIVASIKQRWTVQTVASVLMVCARLDLVTLATATSLLVYQWIQRRRLPVWFGLGLVLAMLGWGLLAMGHLIAPLAAPHLNLAAWQREVQQLLDESELYLVFLPLIVCGGIGLALVKSRSSWALLLWGAWVVMAVLIGGAVAAAMLFTQALFLAGLGIDWAIEWIARHNVVRLDRLALTASVALIAALPLGIAQTSSLVRRYQFRPVIRQELEQQAGDWLRAYTEPTATVVGSQRLGYLAQRDVYSWGGSAENQGELANLMVTLTENPPDYIVSLEDTTWDQLRWTNWFQDGYEPLRKFESPYEVTSPFTIWGRRPGASGLGDPRPLNVRMPGGVDLVGYRYGPERIQPGDTIYVTLFLQAMQPITKTFRTVVVMSIPEGAGDWMHWRHEDTRGDRSIPVDWWQSGQVISEEFELQTRDDLPVGAYRLDVSVLGSDGRTYMPIYQDDDTSPLDRVMLGYVAVPWEGEMDKAKLADANLGDQIRLLGFEVMDSLSPGSEFDVTLYWGAERSPEDDYVVFVHLLDAEGKAVASHDGPPMEGRTVTSAWLPGDVIRDNHRLVLDPSTPAGTYRLQVGMYSWPNLERLPVWDSEGEQTERAVFLQSIQVR